MHQEQLIQRTQALSFVTALPCLEQKIIPRREPSGAPLAASFKPASRPTHLLYRHVARPLTESGIALAGGCEIYHGKDGWQLRGGGSSATVNGTAYRSGQILASGDTIAIGTGDAALLIEVVA